MADNESHVGPWIERLKAFEQSGAEIVVPGHGHIGGPELIADYRGHFELVCRRVDELRNTSELSEADIVDRVSRELVDQYPNWDGRNWAQKIVADLTWPSRA